MNLAHRGARKRSAPLTGGVRVRGQGSVLDQYLPHFDAVIRQGVVLAARPEEVYAWLRSFDFAQMCEPVGRAIEDMRAGRKKPCFLYNPASFARALHLFHASLAHSP